MFDMMVRWYRIRREWHQQFIPRCLFAFSTILLTILIYHYISTMEDESSYYRIDHCQQTQDLIDDLLILAGETHKILKLHAIPHFMCYGTLWGAIRKAGPFPWDRNIDFCVIKDEWDNIDKGQIYQNFRWEDIGLMNDERRCRVQLFYGNAYANLVLFEYSSDRSLLERCGWENWILANKKNLNFPSSIINSQLRMMKFGHLLLPAPEKPLDLQKYLYPDDWWTEVIPKGCNMSSTGLRGIDMERKHLPK